MSETHNQLVGSINQKRNEEHEAAVRRLENIKKKMKHVRLRYVLQLGHTEICTNSPAQWIKQGAVIVREILPTGEDKPRRGRPRK